MLKSDTIPATSAGAELVGVSASKTGPEGILMTREEKLAVLRTALLELVRYEELNFTARQIAVLLECMRSSNQTIKSISQTLSVSKPSVSKTVSRLHDLGLLERKPHPYDRRVIFVLPTRAADDLIASLYPESDSDAGVTLVS